MNNIIRWIVALIASVVLCSCNSIEKKAEKVLKYYNNQGYRIMGFTAIWEKDRIHYRCEECEKHYILFSKNDSVYLDTEFKSKGKSAVKIYPPEKGIKFKKLDVSFCNGIKFTKRPVEYKNNNQYFKILFHDKNNPNGKDLLYSNMARPAWNFDKSVYYFIGDEEALVMDGECWDWDWGEDSFSHDMPFTLADVFDNYDYRYPLDEYPFLLEVSFSKKDLSVLEYELKLIKENLPCKLIKEKVGQLGESGDYLYVPGSWIGTSMMDKILECIERDIDEKEAKLEMERMQREQEEAIKLIEDNAVDFNTMRSDYSNPFLAEKKYSIGQDMLLKLRIDKIEYSYSGYTYVLSWLGSFTTDVYVYTNDNNFAELDYPQIVWIQAKYSSRYEAWDNTVTYKFTDAQLLLWKKPGLFE